MKTWYFQGENGENQGPFSSYEMDKMYLEKVFGNFALIKFKLRMKYQKLCNMLFEWTSEPYKKHNYKRYKKKDEKNDNSNRY